MKVIKRINKIYRKWKKNRLTKEFYLTQNSKPTGESFFQYLIIFLGLSIFAFWKAATYQELLVNIGIVLLLFLCFRWIYNKIEYKSLVKICLKNISDREFKKRLSTAANHDVLQAVKQTIENNFLVKDVKIQNGYLEGIYGEDKVAVLYYYVEDDDIVEVRDILALMKEYSQMGIQQLRIFTNGDFNSRVLNITERYGIKVRLYNEEKLRKYLMTSAFYPSLKEANSIIDCEIEKRQKRLSVIKKQAFQGNKFISYFSYSLLLLMMARFKIGFVYWNIIFGILLLGLAFISLGEKIKDKEEKIIF